MQEQLHAILGEILARNRPGAEQAISPDADFSLLGINSIDLLEFVLRVEEAFDVAVLDEITPEDLPTSLAGWSALVARLTQVPGR